MKIEKYHQNRDKQSCKIIHLLGAPGTGKSRTCIELDNILSHYAQDSSTDPKMKKLIQNAIHIKTTFINGTGPTESDQNPSYGLALRILNTVDLSTKEVINGNSLLDSLFSSIAIKKKTQLKTDDVVLISLCIDDYNQIIRYFSNGRDLLKQLTSDVGNCMSNPNYILFPIFSGTIDLSIENDVFTGSFFPSVALLTNLLHINEINGIIYELSQKQSFKYLRPLLNNRGFIRLVQSIGGHCRSLEFLIEIIGDLNHNLSFDFDVNFKNLMERVQTVYNFKWIDSPNDLIEAYILRTSVTKITKFHFPKEVSIHNLEASGIIYLSPEANENHFFVDFPYIWLKILINRCDDVTLKTLFQSIFSIMEHEISGRDFEKFNYYLLSIKIHLHILKKKKTFSLRDLYKGAHFINPEFDLLFDTPNSLKNVELTHQYPDTKQPIEENVVYSNVSNASFADIFYLSKNSLFEQEKYSFKNENISSMISSEYAKVERLKLDLNKFAFIYVGNGVVDLYPRMTNCAIISEKELTNYYGMAFSPRLTISISKIDINFVSETQLMEIHGIGKKTAEKILFFRKNGKCTVSNIQKITGFNEREMKTLKDSLIFDD